jgi:hypothetical protein
MILRQIILLGMVLFYSSAAVQADTLSRQPLFKIERSKNANIIQYDAQVEADGGLFPEEPVVAYWVRLARQGQIEELSWLQRTFAFGFDTNSNPEDGTVTMDMKADIDRPLFVVQDGDRYRAKTRIDGKTAYLDRLYIKARQKILFISVKYVELFGEDTESGEPLYEKVIPGRD